LGTESPQICCRSNGAGHRSWQALPAQVRVFWNQEQCIDRYRNHPHQLRRTTRPERSVLYRRKPQQLFCSASFQSPLKFGASSKASRGCLLMTRRILGEVGQDPGHWVFGSRLHRRFPCWRGQQGATGRACNIRVRSRSGLLRQWTRAEMSGNAVEHQTRWARFPVAGVVRLATTIFSRDPAPFRFNQRVPARLVDKSKVPPREMT